MLCTCNVVLADDPANYFGIDYVYRWMKGENTDTYAMQPVLPSNYQGGEVYYAHRFENNVGFDIGYEQSELKTVTSNFAANSSFLGVTQHAGDYAVFSTRLRAVQFDILGFINFLRHVEAIGQLGFLLMQADMDAIGVSSGVTNNLAPGRAINFIPRCGIGLQYFLFHKLGIRAMAGWENTNNFRFDITDEDGIRRTIGPFMNSWVFSVGLVAKFK